MVPRFIVGKLRRNSTSFCCCKDSNFDQMGEGRIESKLRQAGSPLEKDLARKRLESRWRCSAKVYWGNCVRGATIRMGRIIICDQMNRPQKWLETMSEWSYSPV